jgi:hypothetical protein
VDKRLTGNRLVRRREDVGEVVRDPLRFVVGEGFKVVLAAEDGDRDEVAVVVLYREVGDESFRHARVLEVPALQRLAHRRILTVQGVSSDHGVDRITGIVTLGERRRSRKPNSNRGEQTRRCRRSRPA